MRNIGLIIGREFRERVYKKSFIFTTILMPLFMILMGAAPTLIMEFADSETRKITVVDESGIVAPRLESDKEVQFVFSDKDIAETLVATAGDEDNFGVLHIGKDIVENPNDARLYTTSSSSMMLEEYIADQIEKVIESERLKAYNIENIDEILEKVKASVHLATFRTDQDKKSAASSAIASSVVGMVLGFLLYFILAIYGGMVMQSVIEEKNSRILEVMVSTVRPFDMLMGKILGIALVAATQILVWGVLLVLFSAVIMPALMPENILDSVQQVQAGADASAIAMQQDIAPEMLTAGLGTRYGQYSYGIGNGLALYDRWISALCFALCCHWCECGPGAGRTAAHYRRYAAYYRVVCRYDDDYEGPKFACGLLVFAHTFHLAYSYGGSHSEWYPCVGDCDLVGVALRNLCGLRVGCRQDI